MDSIAVLPGADIMKLLEKINETLEALICSPREQKTGFISNGEFMKMMQVSKRTAQTWRDNGIIPFSQIGGKIYYKTKDVEILLNKNRYDGK